MSDTEFTFKTDDLHYGTLENIISEHFGIKSVQTSNLPMKAESGQQYDFFINGLFNGVSGLMYVSGSGKHFTVIVTRPKIYSTVH